LGIFDVESVNERLGALPLPHAMALHKRNLPAFRRRKLVDEKSFEFRPDLFHCSMPSATQNRF
jgi:hypothetical protein